LFQLFRLGCRTFRWGRGTGSGGEDEVGRVSTDPFFRVFPGNRLVTSAIFSVTVSSIAVGPTWSWRKSSSMTMHPAEDLAVEEVVDYDDLVPAISVEEIVWQVAAVDHIASVEDEETTERVTSPVVVGAVSGLADAVGVGRAGTPSNPGPSGGSVSVDDLLPGPRPGPVVSSSDADSDEVMFVFLV